MSWHVTGAAGGLALFVVGAVVAILAGFQIWRRAGGPQTGKRLSQLDPREMPLGLRLVARVAAIASVVGLVRVVVALF